LVELSLSQRTAPQAREAIAAGRRDIVLPKLHDEIVARLESAEYEDYLRLAEVAARVQAWETLKSIIRSARTRHDPEVLEMADDYVHAYGALVA
jgi:hypothetical protein